MHIIIFGDSIGQGFFDTEHNGWASHLSVYLQQKTLDSQFDIYYSVFNQSISGENTTEIYERLKNEITPRLSSSKKNVILFAGGINDAKRLQPSNDLYVPLEKTKQNVQKFIHDAKKLVDEVVFVGSVRVDEALTTNYVNDSFENSDIEMYDQVVAESAREHGLVYVPLSDLIQHEHLADGLHPNAEGHRLIYERVKSELEKAGIL